jgi:serine O-acetyltransferase
MIETKKDYLFYLERDRLATGQKRKRPRLFGDEVWKFQRLLRKLEYFTNCRKSRIYKPALLFLKLRFRRASIRLGFDIPCNVFGPGLSIAHYGTIIVNGAARIGANCRIHTCVNIGTKAGNTYSAPKIGDNVYIGPGAKIFGPIEIASGVAIGANSVVNKSFKEPNITIAGAPARKISEKGSEGLLVQSRSRPSSSA